MHDLEYQLHKLAVRMEKRGRKKLAEELFILASASHNYSPDFPECRRIVTGEEQS